MIQRLHRAPLALVAAASLVATAAMIATDGAARAASFAPTYFPSGVALDGNAYALQFSGANREGTAAAIALDMALGQDVTGGYPFGTPAGIPPKTDSTKLYGAKQCPATVVLAADDTPADALSAAALRSFGSIPVTDVHGTLTGFNTQSAALLLTTSGREGATDLDPTTAAALGRLRAACGGTIPFGIALGGTAAIPDTVFNAFEGLVGDAGRIAGADRFQTAALVAAAAKAAAGSLPTVSYYPAPTTPSPVGTGGTALAETVFLAEGQTGADALAVGALAARHGVPILLTDTASLPASTHNALATLLPKNIVVLGGSAAVSDAVVSAATGAAGSGSTATRIFGDTRYGTSVAIAEKLFNLYPTYASAPGLYSDQLFGFARDEGSAAVGNHTGWPDALASAYYLAQLAPSGVANPTRTAPAAEQSLTDGTSSPSTIAPPGACGTNPTCFPNYPLLLTSGGALDGEVAGYLRGLFPTTNAYKTGTSVGPTNDDGGFGFVFGGAGSVQAPTQIAIAQSLAGGTYQSQTDLSPSLDGSKVFFTTADLGAFGTGSPGITATLLGGGGTAPKACSFVGALGGVDGVAAIDEKFATDATTAARYYGATSAYSPRTSLGACVSVATEAGYSGTSDIVTFYGAGIGGHESGPVFVSFPPSKTLSSGGPTAALPAASTSSGNVFGLGSTGTKQTETTNAIPLPFTDKGTTFSSGVANLTVTISRTAGANGQDVISWTGTLTGYQDSGHTATPIFVATVAGGVSDTTPVTGALITHPINLLGQYGAPGGAIVLQVSPPATPTTPSAEGGLVISGLA